MLADKDIEIAALK